MDKEPSFARRSWKALGFGLLGCALSLSAGSVWSAMVVSNLQRTPAIPWSVPAMGILLWLMWRYLGGWGWPRSTQEARRAYLRANRRSGSMLAWAIAAGVLSVVALTGIWIVLVDLVRMPPNPLPDLSKSPKLTIALMILMSSLVAPFMEEAGFRGYFQVSLERAYRGPAAVVISALVFALAHYTQDVLLPKLFVYFLAGLVFGVTAYLTQSTLPAILPHMIGDLTFFVLVWPNDAKRTNVWYSGPDLWFWIHVAQAIIFSALAVWAFQWLERVSEQHFKRIATPPLSAHALPELS